MTSMSSVFGGLRGRLETAVDRSAVVGAVDALGSTVERWAGGSRMVRWFLSEPDPAVVVIDLRKTYTVGPVLRLVAWGVDRGRAVADRTGITTAASTVGRRVRAAPVRVAGLATVVAMIVSLAVAVVAGGAVGWRLVVAGIALLATRERRSAARLAETRVGRALRPLLVPPEPPERE